MKNIFLLIIGLFGFGFCGMAQPFDVVWTDLVNVTANGNSLEKTSSTDVYDAGAFSTNVLSAGEDGWIEGTAGEVFSNKFIGLSDVNVGEHYINIDYGIFFYGISSQNYIRVYENGTYRGNFLTYTSQDVLRIERVGTTIYYKKNGNTFYTSTIPSTTDLSGDVSIHTQNGYLNDVVASFDTNGNSGGNNGGSSSLWSANGDDIYYNSGNVGIGNDTPTSLLHITASAGSSKGLTVESGGNTNFQVMGDGRVFAREVEVTLANFPDYVFADDYTLMPLGQLKKYIDDNHHLPNIPSAKAIEENGIGMGELNLKQVEKIEELTLYILQLDERLQKLEAENEALKRELQKD